MPQSCDIPWTVLSAPHSRRQFYSRPDVSSAQVPQLGRFQDKSEFYVVTELTLYPEICDTVKLKTINFDIIPQNMTSW